ncbi:MAG: HD domain-containing protein [Deltaproteobacteria bacterium]|nr:HD domain-containing protein [Deltaproteobacteria bacterium]
MDRTRAVEITTNVERYRNYDVYYQDPTSERFVLYKPRGVDVDKIRVKMGMVPKRLYVSLNDQLDFVSSRHQEYNKRLKTILKTEPLESKQLLTRILDLAVSVPVGEVVPHMRATVDIVLREYLADEAVVKRMVEVTLKDASTSVHSVNVMLHCLACSRQAGYGYDDLKSFGLMGLFHDIGKLEIPDSILKAPRRLTADEFDLIKTHPKHGYNMLVQTKVEKRVRLGALQHHERCDGSGYPKKLEGKDLLAESKILAIIDVYEALTNWRPYKDPVGSLNALGIIKKDVVKGRLDEEMFQDFAMALVGMKL